MRALPVLLASALLGLAATGCGGADKASGSRLAHSGSYLRHDGDKDSDDQRRPKYVGVDEQHLLATYGGRPSAADTRAITALVKRYYAASVAEDGAIACSLLVSSLAAGIATQHSRTGGADGESCTEAMAPVLKREHERLSAEDPSTMTVIEAHVRGALGLAVLGFERTPESELVLEREGRAWKIDALVDGYMP